MRRRRRWRLKTPLSACTPRPFPPQAARMASLRNLPARLASRPRLCAPVLGAAAACGFAPLGLWPLTLLAVAGLIELTARAPSWKQAALIGWLFGVGHFTLGNNWIATAFTYQAKMPVFLGWIAVLALALYLAVYPALAALASVACRGGAVMARWWQASPPAGSSANGCAAGCSPALPGTRWRWRRWGHSRVRASLCWRPGLAPMRCRDWSCCWPGAGCSPCAAAGSTGAALCLCCHPCC